jgi:hypothetical protein
MHGSLRTAAILAACVFFAATSLWAEDKALLGAPDFKPSPETPYGWRGDGNGRFPGAQPPLKWGRRSKAVTELRTQPSKPKEGETGKPLAEGTILDWLVLGPVPIPAGKQAKEDFGVGEGEYAPDPGQKLGEAEWKPHHCDAPVLNFNPLYVKSNEVPKGFVAYACAWLYSPSGKPVFLNQVVSADTLLWLNGKLVGNFSALGSHPKLALQKGWNRLLFRIAPLPDVGWSKGQIEWFIKTSFYGTDPADYETQNIVWSTPLPDNGPGAGSPIVVGDRIFVTGQLCDLICIQKSDGKVLWAKANTCADAATEEEKKASVDVFVEIAPLQKEIDASLAAYRAGPDPKRKPTGEPEQKINALMKKVNAEKYKPQSGGEAGEAAQTPISDGQNVYVIFGSGVVACYTLDGKRQWITMLEIRNSEHGCCSSPALIDGKLIFHSGMNFGAAALDCKTGTVVWKTPAFKGGTLNMMASAIKLPLGQENLVLLSYGTLLRPRDGEVLQQSLRPPYPQHPTISSSTFEGRRIAGEGWGQKDGKTVAGFAFQTLPDSAAEVSKVQPQVCGYDTLAFPTWFNYDQIASPLLYQGLAYVMNTDGVLTVFDAEKAAVVYQKQLDLTPYVLHGGAVRGGCAASPTLGGNYIYIWDNQNTALILEPGRTYKVLGRNRIEQLYFAWGAPQRNEATNSCPVFEGKKIYYRGEVNLYCIGEQ